MTSSSSPRRSDGLPAIAELYEFRDALKVLAGEEPDPTDIAREAEAVELAEDYVPSIEDAALTSPPPATYRDWLPEETRVLVYTTDPATYPKDRPATTRASAKAECELCFGKVLEANYVGERCFFRVRRAVRVR